MRDRLLFAVAAGLIVLAFIFRTVVPADTVYRIRAGNIFYRPDTFLFWSFMVAGLGVCLIAILKITVRWLVRLK